MAHLAINDEGWTTLPHETAEECSELAGRIGLTNAEVINVFIEGAPPDEHFIACSLFYLPLEFDDLFQIRPPALATSEPDAMQRFLEQLLGGELANPRADLM